MSFKVVLCLAFACLVTGKPHHNHGHHYGNYKHDGARPSTGTCGNPAISPNPSSQFIVGGTEATEHSYPWMVALMASGNWQFCGGTLLDNTHVVTAAHCVGRQDTDTVVAVGLHDKNHQDSHSELIQHLRVSRIEQHNQYDSRELLNDIAMITLAEPATYNAWVSPCCVASSQKPVGSEAVATGWGHTTEGGSSSSVLMQVTVPIVSDQECADKYSAIGWNVFADEMLCAGYDQGGKDGCQGDSGGPLVQRNSFGNWELVGITSWGYGCARPNFPGVYADVANYHQWITSRLN